MSLESFNPIPEFIEPLGEVAGLEIPDFTTGESLLADTERVSNLMHGLGSIPLSETVELQSATIEAPIDSDELSYDSENEEPVVEEEIEQEPEEEKPDEETPKRKEKPQPKKPYSLYDGSETRSAALDMIYIATAVPVDEIAA